LYTSSSSSCAWMSAKAHNTAAAAAVGCLQASWAAAQALQAGRQQWRRRPQRAARRAGSGRAGGRAASPPEP
jgi:hypothetical protein